jgi:hypothetical protein
MMRTVVDLLDIITEDDKILKSSIPGVHYQKSKAGSYKYYSAHHTASGKQIANWTGAPVNAKDKNFVAAADSALKKHSHINWNMSADDLGKKHKTEDLRKAASDLQNVLKRKGGDAYEL